MSVPEYQGFWDHVEDLRIALLRSLKFAGLGILLALFIAPYIFNLLLSPLAPSQLSKQSLHYVELKNNTSQSIEYTLRPHEELPGSQLRKLVLLPDQSQQLIVKSPELTLLSPAEGMAAYLKIAFWSGLLLSAPLWGYSLVQFFLPALHSHERGLIVPFIGLSIFMMSIGSVFAYLATIPLANEYLTLFNTQFGYNFWSLSAYLDYTLLLLAAHAIAFEAGAILLMLVHLGIFPVEQLERKRRHVIVGSFILAALLTPPDVLTQFLLAIPLCLLYEIALLYGRFRKNKIAIGDQKHHYPKIV